MLLHGLCGGSLVSEGDREHQAKRVFKGVRLLSTALQLQALLFVADGLSSRRGPLPCIRPWRRISEESTTPICTRRNQGKRHDAAAGHRHYCHAKDANVRAGEVVASLRRQSSFIDGLKLPQTFADLVLQEGLEHIINAQWHQRQVSDTRQQVGRLVWWGFSFLPHTVWDNGLLSQPI